MTHPRYIHVRNWDKFQHPDVTRGKTAAAPWIKDHTGQLHDDEWVALSLAERGLLQSIRLEYAARRCKGLPEHTAALSRLIGQRVLKTQIERLNQAGFIRISASKLQAEIREDSTLELGELGELKNPLPASAGEKPPTKERPPDPVWDELVQIFGNVADKTSAHGKRNKAAADLRRHEATPELIRLAIERALRQDKPLWVASDVALAKHYPQLVNGARQTTPPCEDCGVGGGMHDAACPRVAAKPGDLERFLEEADEEAA